MTMYLPPICKGCTHFRERGLDPDAAFNTGSCNAYPAKPNGIPVAIWQSAADHRQPYPGDNGIRFAPKDAAAKGYAALLFKPNYAERPSKAQRKAQRKGADAKGKP